MPQFKKSDIIDLEGRNFLWVFPVTLIFVCIIGFFFNEHKRVVFLIIYSVFWGGLYLSRRLTITNKILILFGLNLLNLIALSWFVNFLTMCVAISVTVEHTLSSFSRGDRLYIDGFRKGRLSTNATYLFSYLIFSLFSFLTPLEATGISATVCSLNLIIIGALFIIMKFPDKYDSWIFYIIPKNRERGYRLLRWVLRKADKDPNIDTSFYSTGSPPPGQDSGNVSASLQDIEREQAKKKANIKANPTRRQASAIFRSRKKSREEGEEVERSREEVDRQRAFNELEEKRVDIKRDKVGVEGDRVENEKIRADAIRINNEAQNKLSQAGLISKATQLHRRETQIINISARKEQDYKLQDIVRAKRDLELTFREKKHYLDAYKDRLNLLKNEIGQSYKYQMKALKMAEEQAGMNLQRQKDSLTKLYNQAQNRLTQAILKEKDIKQYMTGIELDRKASVITAIESDWWNSDEFRKIDAYNKQGLRISNPVIDELQKYRDNERQLISQGGNSSPSIWSKIFGR